MHGNKSYTLTEIKNKNEKNYIFNYYGKSIEKLSDY